MRATDTGAGEADRSPHPARTPSARAAGTGARTSAHDHAPSIPSCAAAAPANLYGAGEAREPLPSGRPTSAGWPLAGCRHRRRPGQQGVGAGAPRPWRERAKWLSFFNLVLVFKAGAAFSFLADAGGWQKWFFVVLALGISAWLLVMLRRHAQRTPAAGGAGADPRRRAGQRHRPPALRRGGRFPRLACGRLALAGLQRRRLGHQCRRRAAALASASLRQGSRHELNTVTGRQPASPCITALPPATTPNWSAPSTASRRRCNSAAANWRRRWKPA